MIQTISYNDFSKYDYISMHNLDFMLEEMKQFVNEGGNLNLDVFNREKRVVKFVDFIKDIFNESHVHVLEQILKNNWIDNPFNFVIENNHITDNKLYNMNWLQNNYDSFKNLILESLENLAKDTNSIHLEHYSAIKDYEDSPIINKIKSPLFYIAEQLDHKPEIWNIFLKYNSQVKEFMKDYLKNPLKIQRFFNIHNDKINNSDLANIFYKHGIITDYLNKNTESSYELISSAISTNDLESLKKLSKNFNFSEIEKTQELTGAFVGSAQDPEVVKLLLDNNCFFSGQWKGKNSDKEFSLAINSYIDPETLDAILSHPKVNGIDLIEKHTDAFYHKIFLKDNNNGNSKFKNIKLLVEKYKFPLQHKEMLKIAHEEDQMAWFIKNGADPRQCEEFITKIINRRDKSTLSKYKKEGLINPYSPDMLYAGAAATSTTKMFTDYFGKANAEQWSYLTKDGLPAWWGIADQGLFSVAKYNITNYNQLSSKGQSWLNHLTKNIVTKYGGHDSQSVIKKLKVAKDCLKRNQHEQIIGICTPGNFNNFLHNIFKFDSHRKESVDEKLVNFVFENVNTDFKALLEQKNSEGIYPLEYFFMLSDSGKKFLNYSSTEEALISVINHMQEDFPFEQMIKGKSVLSLLEENLKPENYKLAHANYLTKKIKDKIDHDLPEKMDKSPSIKI